MGWGQQIAGMATRLVQPFVSAFDQRNLLSYLAAAGFLFAFVAVQRLIQRRRHLRVRAVIRLLTRRSVWLHASSRLDYRLYLLNMLLLAATAGVLIIGSAVWAGLAGHGLNLVLGPASSSAATPWAIASAAVALLLAFDFGYWLGHLAMHKSAVLWEFHKVHHSALVMTPATEFRQHPVELLLIPTTISLAVGVALALVDRLVGEAAATQGQTVSGLILTAHIFSFHHLRHSHINMPFTGWPGRLLHSPAHHLLHHSDAPEHHDRNMGYLLSVWDWAAGTLVVPVRNQRVTLGIGPEGATHDSVAATLWLPVRNAAAILLRRPRPT